MPKTTERLEEYRVSERVNITKGDTFKARGGPQWKCDDGMRVSLAAKGPFKFVAYCRRGSCEWIEAIDKGGACVTLHIGGRRRRVSSQIIPRPYTIVGKKRGPNKKKRVDSRGSMDTATKGGRS
jgi:hypothetical protein